MLYIFVIYMFCLYCVIKCIHICLFQEWYVALVKSQCCLRGEGALYETTELLTKLPQPDLSTIMTCKVKT